MNYESITIAGLVDKTTGEQFYRTRHQGSGFNAYMSPGTASGGRWWGTEKHVENALKRLLHVGKRFADVGAHHGRHSLVALSRGASVHAFEPCPANHEMLEMNLEGTGILTWKAYEVAIDEESVMKQLQLFDNDSCCNSFHRGKPNVPVENVICQPLSDFGRFDVVKVDTEGNELSVLRSADSPETTTFIVEPHQVGESSPAEIIKWGSENGLDWFHLDQAGRPERHAVPNGMRHILLQPKSQET